MKSYTLAMKELLQQEIRKVLEDAIFPDLLKGRSDFDLLHTQAVVYWMEKILEAENKLGNTHLDPLIMITAAYAHDWGYAGLFDGLDSNDPKVIATKKAEHMERGSIKLDHLIHEELADYFSELQHSLAVHLVLMHDKVEDLLTEPEITIMEADTLGMLDTDRMKPTFSKEENEHFIASQIEQRRLPRFIHDSAKKQGALLKQKRREWYNSGRDTE